MRPYRGLPRVHKKIAVLAATITFVLPVALFAQSVAPDGTQPVESPEESASPGSRVDVDDFRARGRVAIREWIATRRNSDKSKRANERKEFDATIELALALHGAGGGDVVNEVLAEAEEKLGPAKRRARGEKDQARMVANVGTIYHRIVGDSRAARRLYQEALDLDPTDEVASQGLARLAMEEEIDLQKEVETERIKELQDAFEKEPRSRPPARTPIDAIHETDAKP